MPNDIVRDFFPPKESTKAQVLPLKCALYASKVLLFWNVAACIADLTIGQFSMFESLARLVAAASGLLPILIAGRQTASITLNRSTYWRFIVSGGALGLGIAVMAALVIFNASPGGSQVVHSASKGLLSALFITPCTTYLALGMMRFKQRLDHRSGRDRACIDA